MNVLVSVISTIGVDTFVVEGCPSTVKAIAVATDAVYGGSETAPPRIRDIHAVGLGEFSLADIPVLFGGEKKKRRAATKKAAG